MRFFGIVKEEVRIRPVTMQCPYRGHSPVILRYRGHICQGRCFLASQHTTALFRASALRKAGCPRPQQGLFFSGFWRCKLRDGDWVEI